MIKHALTHCTALSCKKATRNQTKMNGNISETHSPQTVFEDLAISVVDVQPLLQFSF
jgi:hypothetical protein